MSDPPAPISAPPLADLPGARALEAPSPDSSPPPPASSKVLDAGLAVLLVMSFGAPLLLGVAAGGAMLLPPVGVLFALVAFMGLLVWIYRVVRGPRRPQAVLAAQILILGILPVWGLLYSHFLGQGTCSVDACSEADTVFRPFAEPEVFGLVALHLVTVVAYVVSRRRPAALRPIAEALVHAALVAGVIAHLVIGVHVGRWLGVGLLIAPVFLPVVGPLLTIGLYVAELHARLRRRGIEADRTVPWRAPDSLYREGPVQEALPPPPRVHRPSLLRAFAFGPALLGLHAVVQALIFGRADSAAAVFTRTCGHVLSGLPIVVHQVQCHYLCTVAARGHTWLVRPERFGRRGGHVIVVNRQLAIANAFEDLLHERWPRFGRLARRVYDRLGLPISRYLRRPWLADLTYLAMKPAEWLFAIVLLLLDRGDPEQRIDRMYR